MEFWYAVQTKPRKEDLAEANLSRQAFEVFLPRIKDARRRRGHWQDVIDPLFPRYLFVKADLEKDNVAPIRSTLGVTGLVRFGSEHVPVPRSFIEGLMSETDKDTGITLRSPQVFNKGDKVRMVKGPFAGVEAIFEAVSGEQRVMILLELLNRQNVVTMNTNYIVPA